MRLFIVYLLFVACGGSAVQDSAADDLTVAATIGPQSLTHGSLTSRSPQVAYAFNGKAGDIVAPDLWPTGKSALNPTLALLGPKGSNGHRPLLATGAPRGTDASHPAIDGFRLPKTGNYLIVVGVVAGGRTGKFSLRLWSNASHLPRQEGSQVDLNLTPSAGTTAALQGHAASPHPWTDAEVDGLVAEMQQQTDPRVAFSDADYLLSALVNEQATDAQRARVRAAVAALVGTPAHFAKLSPQIQTFALWWLGGADGTLFGNAPQAAQPAGIDQTVVELVAAWPGAHEVATGRTVEAKVLNGSVYGWQVEWQGELDDTDGRQVWVDWSREWFDASGHWLLEQSPGASEPDDD